MCRTSKLAVVKDLGIHAEKPTDSNVHGDMSGVGLDTTDTDTIPSRPTGAQDRSVVGAEDERVAICVGQIF